MILKAEFEVVHGDIVDRCQSGDSAAYKEIYDLYSKAMFNICYRMMDSREEAEDLLQDAFFSAFKSIHYYRKESSFGSWLKRIVINKCINAMNKKQLLTTELNQEFGEESTLEYEDYDPINYEDYGVVKLKQTIKKLSKGYRAVLTLYLLEGYDHSEIAGILGITESTSKTQYLRAKKKLRELLKDEGYER